MSQSTNHPEQSVIHLPLSAGIELTLVRVPAGEFLLGSDPEQDKEAFDNEKPQQRLYLEEYWIGKHTITNAQYRAYVVDSGQPAPDHWLAGGQIPRYKEDHPVTFVCWDDALNFCDWATKVTGVHLRLPSEAEWEKAARGVDGRIWPWGNQHPDRNRCNFWMRLGDTCSVGRFSPQSDSPYGCTDMAGNVWELTSTLFKAYPYNPDDGREDPVSREWRVVRGGAFDIGFEMIRCAYRGGGYPHLRGPIAGFRVCAKI